MRTQADLAAGRHIQSTDDLDAVVSWRGITGHGRSPAGEEVRRGGRGGGRRPGRVFRDGADGVISGQTMNPPPTTSCGKIDAAHRVVFVLPNKNIIMAAEQVRPPGGGQAGGGAPHQDDPQGISALMVMDPEAGRGQPRRHGGGHRPGTHLEITYAARDSDFDGFAIKRGDYLALTEHQLFGTDRKLEKLLRRLAEAEAQQSAEFINIIRRGCQ